MSGEVLHPTQEATTNSNGVSKDLQSTSESSPPGKIGTLASKMIDMTSQAMLTALVDSSAASPVASTFLNSASTTAQTSPVQGPSGVSDNSEQFSSDTALDRSIATQDTAPGTETLVKSIPSTNLATGKGGDFPVGQEKSSKRGSKGSIKAPSRKGSAASSKVSNKEKIAVLGQEKSVEIKPSDNPERPKKGLSRFFSTLICCSSKDAHVSDSIPPKKANTLQANRGRQPTPMTKPNASAGESSNTESKEAIEDNIAGPPYSELTPAAKPKIIEPPKKETEKAPVSDSLAVAEARNMAPPIEQPLPPLPSDSKVGTSYGFDEKAGAMSTDGLAEPTVSTAETEVSKEETINDRTPQQEARDIEMTDAPPVPEVPQQESTVPSPPHSNLPPPPPINPPPSDRQPSTIIDQQKWLLPPLTDRFRGKKCLVLDLDETLVHSSFKVCNRVTSSPCGLTFLDPASSRLHDTR